MKQILQNLSNGETSLVDLPAPKIKQGCLLISTSKSVISSGTEKMLLDFGKAGYLQKAMQQPDKLKEVLSKVKTDGIIATYDAVKTKLDQPIPLGYCNAGVVLESKVEGYEIGDRVISNGNHAEIVRVHKNLCSKIPQEVDDDTASFTVIASIGLQGIRLFKPTLGETVVVFGLGLVGLLTVQMLKASGCKVIAIDYNSKRCAIAKEYGAEIIDLTETPDPVAFTDFLTNGMGVDGVLITASTESNELIHQAAIMCRKRGRIVLIGQTGLKLSRDDFYEKELTFQVSASYGPGRYDLSYEEDGNDYPIGFVRWTEKRNFEAVLSMMKEGQIDINSLITHRFDIENGPDAYKTLDDKDSLAVIIEYKDNPDTSRNVSFGNIKEKGLSKKDLPNIAFIGAGNYASRTLIPAFKKSNVILNTLFSSGGISGYHHGQNYGFEKTSTDIDDIWKDEDLDTVVITTRHNSHANLVSTSIRSDKNIFVEKPLALSLSEIEDISQVYKEHYKISHLAPRLMVGFNRRFAPLIVKLKSLLKVKIEPKVIIMTINAGSLPVDHWVNNPVIGGGKIISVGCHFIDLLCFLTEEKIVNFSVKSLKSNVDSVSVETSVSINFELSGGSIATINYLSNGGQAFSKERIEVFCGNGVLQMNNYLSLKGFNWNGFNSQRSYKQDKGQILCVKAFVESIIQGTPSPISFDEILHCSKLAIQVSDSVK